VGVSGVWFVDRAGVRAGTISTRRRLRVREQRYSVETTAKFTPSTEIFANRW